MKTSFAVLGAALSAVRASARDEPGPVTKVVKLLEDLKGKIEGDAKVEQQVYDKYACWCETTSGRKAGAIEKAQDDLRSLGQGILKFKGEVAVLTSELEQLAKEIKQNQEEQAAATNIRSNENSVYQAETAEMSQAIAALQRAIIVLRDATQFLQNGESSNVAARTALKDVVNVLPGRIQLKPDQMSLLSDLVAGKSQYSPQSETIQGILRDMYETFTSDLEKAVTTESTANRDFEDLIATKTAALNILQETVQKKEGQRAEAEQMLADTTQSYDDTEVQKKADIEFFDATKDSCSEKAAEWQTRSSLRAEELKGITEALEVLTSDDARELFSSAIKAGKETGTSDKYDTGVDIAPSLLQIKSESPSASAYKVLKEKASQMHSLRLAMLAVQVRQAKAGHFDEVIKAIDSMISTLADEDKADIAKRDQCKDEYKNIASKLGDVTWKIEKNTAKIDKLQGLIEARTAEKEEATAEIAATQASIEKMTAEREASNQAFLNAKDEDKQAIELLMLAREKLSSYYKNNTIEMGPIQGSVKLVQLHQEPVFEVSADQAPDADFSDKGSHKHESKGIVQLLTMIIEDLNDEIKGGMQGEEMSQLEYEKLKKAAEDLIADLEAKVANLEETIANLGEEKTDEHTDKEKNEGEKKSEEDYKASIKKDCDWIIGAFEKRAAARAAEHNGLTTAKEFLVGYQPSSLLEQKKPKQAGAFDDTKLSKIRFLGMGQ